MTNAVLLSAGQGRRLSPYTDNRPKCLVEVSGRPLLHWQLEALAQAGVTEASVVTGFGAEAVDAALRVIAPPIPVRCRYNPFFAVADNIASCWIARDLFGPDTLLINGDTLVDPRIVARVRAAEAAPIAVAIDRKPVYDDDDMKVRLDGGRLVRIGKDLTGRIDGESIGLLRFRGEGGARFAVALEEVLRNPSALAHWYLRVIDLLARGGGVSAVPIDGLPWTEIDHPGDLAAAPRRLAAFVWERAPRAGGTGEREAGR